MSGRTDMDVAGVDVGGKRRFPQWMLGVAAADQVRKSGNGVANSKVDDSSLPKVHQPALKTETTHMGYDVMLHDNEPVQATSCMLAKCKRKGRKRKSNRQDADFDCDIPKIGKTAQESTPQKRRKAKKLRLRSIDESQILSQSDNDGELTMEDLLSIAKEYVRANTDAEQQQLSNSNCELESQFQSTSPSTRDPFTGPQSNQILPAHEPTAASSKSSENLTSKEILFSSNRTGDPAQDMLSLFLGPLLKQPVEEKKNTEIITEDMAFVSEYRKQSQNTAVGEELVSLMMMKRSIKDQVAMFLD